MFSGINKTPVNRPFHNTQPTRQGAKTTIGSIKTLFNKLACNLLGCKNQVENTPIVLESPKQNQRTDDSSNEQFSKLPADATRNVLTFNELDSYPNIQRIRITETPSAEDIQRIVNVQSSRQILSLDLGWCTSLSDEAICMLAEKCPDITSLNLSYCGQISDAGLAAVAEHCPHLKTLDLSWCNKLTDESIETLANKCQNLVSLNISGCMNMSSAAITALIAACPNLKSLRT